MSKNNELLDEALHSRIKEFDKASVLKNLTWYRSIINPTIREDLFEYNFARRSKSFLIFIFGFFFFFGLTSEFLLLHIQIFHHHGIGLLFRTLSILLYCLISMLSCSLLVPYYAPDSLSFVKFIRQTYGSFKFLFVVSLTTIFIIRFIEKSMISCGPLPSNIEYYYTSVVCNEIEKDSRFAWEIVITAMNIPILFITELREPRLYLILSSFYAIIVSMFIVGSILHLDFYIFFIGWLIGGTIFIADLHLQRVVAFFLHRQLVETFIEKERLTEETQAEEMRHMLANVAHDLKTPLSSFITGIDLIECEVKEITEDSKITEETFIPKLQTVSKYLGDIRNTNEFMVMTINRCIDYTKASKGIKLIPRYETIDLLESLRLPLNCMKNIQNRIEIILNPVPKLICSHIITDKQWLQENVLCLLSNAVKYSARGKVVVTLSLDDFNGKKTYRESVRKSLRDSIRNIVSSMRTLKTPNNKVNDEYSIVPSPVVNLPSDNNTNNTNNTNNNTNNNNINATRKNSTEMTPMSTLGNKPARKVYLRVEIEDTGIGMSDEAMQTLFNPFKQTQRLAGGTGLGLYSLAKRVEALNGRYGVQKRKDGQQGSLFWFAFPYQADKITSNLTNTRDNLTLPLLRRNSVLNANVQHLDKISEPNNNSTTLSVNFSPEPLLSDSNSLQILVVDDSPSIIKMTSMMLRKQGHVVQTAENGQVALEMIESLWNETRNVYDIVLMDLQMPVMDGLEATRRLRTSEKAFLESKTGVQRPRQVVIGVSANSDEDTLKEAIKSGFDDFISKPFTVDMFFSTASKVVAKLIPSNDLLFLPDRFKQNDFSYDI